MRKAERGYFAPSSAYAHSSADCLPVAVQNDQVQAEFKDGILTLTLPKINEARRKVRSISDKKTLRRPGQE